MSRFVDAFAGELEAVGGVIYRVASNAEAAEAVRTILDEREITAVVRTPFAELNLGDGLDVTVIGSPADIDERAHQRAKVFKAGAGLTTVDFGVADTGSLALLAAPENERSVSLLPPVHIALLRAEDIVPELGALFEKVAERSPEPPSALTLITGPSRTGDIELTLTVGVHGPRELHVVLREAE